MNARLNPHMESDLRQVTPEWADLPPAISLPAILALEKRGLIETRGSFYHGTCEVRLTVKTTEEQN